MDQRVIYYFNNFLDLHRKMVKFIHGDPKKRQKKITDLYLQQTKAFIQN